jgi:hypothetical protein
MAIDLPKPRYGAPCNGCGLCCKLEVCGAGEIALAALGHPAQAPCFFLAEIEGLYRCKLVMIEAAKLDRMPEKKTIIADSLGIGWGCTMPDEDKAA